MAGMLKLGDVLAWKLDLTQNNGQRWHLYVDSHGGDLVRADMLDENDKPEYSIIQSDFRETAGFKFAHRIQYADSTGQLLGIEVIDEIVVAQEPFNLSNEAVTH